MGDRPTRVLHAKVRGVRQGQSLDAALRARRRSPMSGPGRSARGASADPSTAGTLPQRGLIGHDARRAAGSIERRHACHLSEASPHQNGPNSSSKRLDPDVESDSGRPSQSAGRSRSKCRMVSFQTSSYTHFARRSQTTHTIVKSSSSNQLCRWSSMLAVSVPSRVVHDG